MARIAMIGSGYVGLTTGICLADLGHDVVLHDCDSSKIAALRQGKVPFHEPGAQELLEKGLTAGKLRIEPSLEAALEDARFAFCCVGTPRKADGSLSLRFVEEAAFAAATVWRHAERPHRFVIKSTVSPGTNARVRAIFAEAGAPHADIVANPEFLSEGTALEDFRRSRIVAGCADPDAAAAVAALFGGADSRYVLLCRPIEAELVKMAANTMLALRVLFGNEMARLCMLPAVGADVRKVLEGVGAESRIGHWGFKPGPGALAGSCFAKDPHGLDAFSVAAGGGVLPIVHGLIESEERHRDFLFHRLLDAVRARGERHAAFWGMAFKADTDDIRDGVPLDFATRLASWGARVKTWDPIVPADALRTQPEFVRLHVSTAEGPLQAAAGAGVLCVFTPATCWAEQDPAALAEACEGGPLPEVFDLRGVLDAVRWISAGFRVHVIGRGDLEKA